jgi:hypothetical protein
MADPAKGVEALYVRYCCLGQFAVQINNTLFLHGGLHSGSGLGFVPGRDARSNSASEWCEGMDAWHVGQMQAFLDNPTTWTEGNDSDRCVENNGAGGWVCLSSAL